MRFFSGKRIGQSGNELVLSVFFSFFLHTALIVLALVLYTAVTPKVHIPPFYEVKLVGQPVEIAPAPPAAAQQPPAPKAEPAPVRAKPQPKVTKVPKPVKAAPKKGDMPELSRQKPKPTQKEEAKPATTEVAKTAPKEPISAPNVPSAEPAVPGAKTEGVGKVSPVSGGSTQLSSYADIIRYSIGRNWNPPPVGKGMKAKVVFKVLRSGRVFGDVTIEEKSGNDYFDMAAKRAILSSSPFPPMPEEFYKQYAEFSVSLQEKE
jgi:TonB family protein